MTLHHPSSGTTELRPRSVIILLGSLNGLMPFTTDLYLPAFPAIARHFHTDIGSVTLSMSSFFIGSCIGQIINGPVLDRFGRKHPMLFGLSLFLLASLGCATAPSIELLISLRFFQALGISMCAVGSRAVVRDIFPVDQTASIFSTLALIMGIAPIIAPSVGSWVLYYFDWRSIFSFWPSWPRYCFLPCTGGCPTSNVRMPTIHYTQKRCWAIIGWCCIRPIFWLIVS